jgi:hypothetical protein
MVNLANAQLRLHILNVSGTRRFASGIGAISLAHQSVVCLENEAGTR